jgi:hypothetical protein
MRHRGLSICHFTSRSISISIGYAWLFRLFLKEAQGYSTHYRGKLPIQRVCCSRRPEACLASHVFLARNTYSTALTSNSHASCGLSDSRARSVCREATHVLDPSSDLFHNVSALVVLLIPQIETLRHAGAAVLSVVPYLFIGSRIPDCMGTNQMKLSAVSIIGSQIDLSMGKGRNDSLGSCLLRNKPPS